MIKEIRQEVANVLNELREPINMSQIWELMSKIAEKYDLEKVNGVYTVKER